MEAGVRVRALTVCPPWSWAIAVDHPEAKRVENRSFGTKYRGPLVIHAGLRWSERGARDGRVLALWRSVHPRTSARLSAGCDPCLMHPGHVVAIAQLVDVHEDTGCCRPWGESEYQASDGSTKRRIFHWVLEDVRQVEPLPARGRLGLWTPDPELLEALAA